MGLSAAGLFAGVYGLIQKEGHPHWGWTDPRIAGWLGAFVIILVVFIVVENKIKDPMMDMHMFKNVHFVGAITVALALGIGIYSFNAFLTALMQNYIGYSALQTGVRQLVMSVWSLILGPITGILGAKYAKKWLISGAMFLGGIGFIIMANAITVKLAYAELWPSMILFGITNGLVNPLLNTAGMEGAEPHEMGMAAGLLNVFRQIGTTVGIVGLGLVQTSRYESYLNAHIGNVKMLPAAAQSGLHKALIKAGPFSGHEIAFSKRLSHAPFAHEFQMLVLRAYHAGMVGVLLTAAGVIFAGGLAAAILMRERQGSVDVN
ncbi:MFS transporter [Lacticaseibacillus sp. GG6-2]